MAAKRSNDEVLLEAEGLRVGRTTLTSPAGEFELSDVLAVEYGVSRSVWVPSLLALIGTVNLAIALQTGKPDMFVAAGLMLGAGIWFAVRGTRHVMTLTTAEGSKGIWFSRNAEECQRACALVKERIEALRLRA